MKKKFVITGIILLIIGVYLFSIGNLQIPTTTTELVNVPKSMVWLDESFVVPPLSHQVFCGIFSQPLGSKLRITFTVTGGGNRDIDFIVLDEEEYWKMRASSTYSYYPEVSRWRVTSIDVEWHPPAFKKICFVWDNSFSLITSKSISTRFYYTWIEQEVKEKMSYETHPEISSLGILILILGLIAIVYGFVSKPPSTK